MFWITGPNNGSDALGSIDTGTIIKKDNKLFIRTTVNKRYITLAPIANLVGLAIDLKDPEGHLDNKKSGITLLLVNKQFSNINMNTHHNPLNIGFPNGQLKELLMCLLMMLLVEKKMWKWLEKC